MNIRRSVLAAALLAVAGAAAPVHASVSTSFTYQGQLKVSGTVVNGAADLRFSLWTASTGGTRIGSTLDSPGLTVTDGMVNVNLDFGAAPFTANQDRWIQIEVRTPAGSGGYQTLSPRQQLTA